MTQTFLAQQLADYSTKLKFDDLSPPVVHEVKRRVLDSLGCALGAWHDDPGVIARQVASTLSAQRGATLLGTTHKAPPDWAAFANGVIVRYLDYNDTYLSKEPAHPSDNIPAALAAAEYAGSNGREFITAIALAYEIQCRLCDAASLRSIGWDHVTYGAFSTAAAAAHLMKLDALQTRHALGIAGVTSAALRQTRVGELSHWKGCAFANAARHGLFAALLAQAGLTGPSPIFEGDNGFEKLVSGPLHLHGPIIGETDDLMILRTSIKCWPVEYHAQSAVEASLALRGQIKDSDTIESVLIQSHDAAVDIIGSDPAKWHPTTRETADHSLPYIVAAALTDGEVTLKTFSPDRIADPNLIAFVQRVKVERHTELSEMYPNAVGNIITVKSTDGRTLSRRVDHPCGHAKNPMSDQQVQAKFHALADPVLGQQRAENIVNWVSKLETAEKMDGLFPLLQVGERSTLNVQHPTKIIP
jgi:2-methylcitrate dehydratase